MNWTDEAREIIQDLLQELPLPVRGQIEEMAAPILTDLSHEDVEGVVAVLSHVWYSSLVGFANGIIFLADAELPPSLRTSAKPSPRNSRNASAS